ncbi:uncharacterized protein [Amphiura filiformis]|uniref:uncharacterized protein n=1 Tax=Amphiura filiformis TaxID=82378 RepID=UPI003B212A3F
MAGPFRKRPLPRLQCSPIGLVEKRTPGEYRLIQHLSFPEGASINDGIPQELCKVEYTSFDEAVALVAGEGEGALMAKSDIKSAFRLLPISPGDFELLGFKFEGNISSIRHCQWEQVVRVPEEKLRKLQEQLEKAVRSESMTLQRIQSLLGLLNFVCRAVAPGRAFMRRLIDLTKGVKGKSTRVTIGKGAREDLKMWLEFLRHFNGVSMFLAIDPIANSELQLFTDAAGGIGMGAFFQGHWTQMQWPGDILCLNPSIAFLELYPIVVAVQLWGEKMANQRIVFRSDNQAVVAIINRKTSKCTPIMSLVRMLVMSCLRFNIMFKAKHIPGVENSIADALSRFQFQRFRQLAPWADKVGTPCPRLVLDI